MENYPRSDPVYVKLIEEVAFNQMLRYSKEAAEQV